MQSILKKITVDDLTGFRIGSVDLTDAGTGCTVILPDGGAVCSVDVRGGGPASREHALLNPLAANDRVNAVLLSGGSAFGLDAASGVMRYLEERGEGFMTADSVVPIVCASCLYDLGVGKSAVRPSAKDGYQACVNAGNFTSGCHGAGVGASVGDILGPDHACKSGIGFDGVRVGELIVAALVAVNAFGDVFDETTGHIIAGAYDAGGFADSEQTLFRLAASGQSFNAFEKQNTTIGAVMTNAQFNKTELTKIAGMAHDGYARAIHPVHTLFDGDSIYALSKGDVRADLNAVGALSAAVMRRAILDAVTAAESAYGLKAARDLPFLNV